MNKIITFLFVILVLNVSLINCQYGTPTFKIDNSPTLQLVKQYNQSQIYSLSSSGYEKPIIIANLTGTHYEMGFAAGYLMAQEAYENYNVMVGAVLPKTWEKDAFEKFLDWQWNDYLSKQITQNYLDEIQGYSDGAIASGFTQLGKTIERGVVISSFPGDPTENIEYLLRNELLGGFSDYLIRIDRLDVLTKIKEIIYNQDEEEDTTRPSKGLQCSHFSTWGDKTLNGDMFNGRNLDWLNGSGISNNKLITFYHPIGQYSHAAIGFAGLIGAIVGISSKGIFVAESDNDSVKVTFDGFAWSMRLRYIMENAANIEEAVSLWESTNNTMGMCHSLASATEASTAEHPAFALETMKGYTAFFSDNDPNEHYIYTDPKTGEQTQMGYPLDNAVYRTNHGYDETIRQNEWEPAIPNGDSWTRYMLFYNTFSYYTASNTTISELQAINITSVLGNKHSIQDIYSSPAPFYDCTNAWMGYNIISSTFHFASNKMFVAFEEGFGQQRICAACGTYVEVDLSPFFGPF
ncbi:hypothetical protein ACTFIY_007014 [Dictyostelium cf. discoideum]